MRPRFDLLRDSRDSVNALLVLDRFVTGTELDEGLITLIKIRTSQINGCALSVEFHAGNARQLGKSEQWIALLSVWRGTPIYNPVERAVLEFAELLAQAVEGVPDRAFDMIRDFFVPRDIARLVLATGAVRMWNQTVLIARSDPRPDLARQGGKATS